MLEGTAPEQHQLTGLPAPASPAALVTAGSEQAGTFRTVAPADGNSWAVNLDALSGAPIAGTHLVVIAPPTTAGPVEISVNGSGPFPIVTGPGAPLDGGAVTAGTTLSLVMDGSSFHVLNGSVYARRPCIAGTVTVNASLCIEPEERVASDMFTAFTTCANAGMRMCSWAEFYTSCQRATELGLLQATNNWEWTSDASNENGSARIVGAGNCASAGNALVTGSIDRTYRCCYSR